MLSDKHHRTRVQHTAQVIKPEASMFHTMTSLCNDCCGRQEIVIASNGLLRGTISVRMQWLVANCVVVTKRSYLAVLLKVSKRLLCSHAGWANDSTAYQDTIWVSSHTL